MNDKTEQPEVALKVGDRVKIVSYPENGDSLIEYYVGNLGTITYDDESEQLRWQVKIDGQEYKPFFNTHNIALLQSPSAPTKAGEEVCVQKDLLSEAKDFVASCHGFADWYQIDAGDISQDEVIELRYNMIDDIAGSYSNLVNKELTAALSTKEAEVARLRQALQTILTNVSTNDEWTQTADLVHFIEKTLNPQIDDQK